MTQARYLELLTACPELDVHEASRMSRSGFRPRLTEIAVAVRVMFFDVSIQ